jgi:lipopolysaccharide/colanic/teichoic acid biosynthesis glycosyltransferase
MSTTHSEINQKTHGHVVVLGDERFGRDRTFYEVFFKRPMDVLIALGALFILAPILFMTWLSIRVMLGKGVLLTQERIGRNGEVFNMLKFRTMRHDRRGSPDGDAFGGNDRRMTHKSGDDPRHTPLGRFLRGASIDELPQLMNVLRGDMSIVGPRPEMHYVAKRDGIVHHPRHVVRPGLTGAFQVSGLRSSEGLLQGLHLDLAYVMDLSFTTDIRIIFKTIGVLVKRTGS